MPGSRIQWDDAGAPDVTTGAGQLNAVLRHCLVTNGDWTEPYAESGNIAMFVIGSGYTTYSYALVVEDISADYAQFYGLRDPTALATGSDRFPTGTTYYYARKRQNASNDPTTSPAGRWWCFYDGGFVNLMLNAAPTGTYRQGIEFGIPILFDSTDLYGCWVGGANASSYSESVHRTAGAGIGNNWNAYMQWCLTKTGSGSPSFVGRSFEYQPSSSAQWSGSASTWREYAGGKYLVSKVLVTDNQRARGHLPGILYVDASRPRTDLEEFTGSDDYAGAAMLAVDFYNNGQVFYSADSPAWGR